MHDLVIRGGKVVDGTGNDEVNADVAVSDGRITEVGVVQGSDEEDGHEAAHRLYRPTLHRGESVKRNEELLSSSLATGSSSTWRASSTTSWRGPGRR